MANTFFDTFDTPLGHFAVIKRNNKVVRVVLPELADGRVSKKKIFELFPDAISVISCPLAEKVRKYILGYCSGEIKRFNLKLLDFNECSDSDVELYKHLSKIPYGTTVSYASLGKITNKTPRATGRAMANNRWPILLPCHRVINADGKLGIYASNKSSLTKKTLLEIEGVEVFCDVQPRIGHPLTIKNIKEEEAIKHLIALEPKFKCIVEAYPFGLCVNNISSVFEALLEAIVFQQLSTASATKIYSKLLKVFSGQLQPLDLLRATEYELRAAGLSRMKIAAIKDLAEFAAQGKLMNADRMQKMPDNELKFYLSRIRGIGKWTVEMMLIFRLGRSDVVSVDDYGLKKGMAILNKMSRLPFPNELYNYCQKFKPYRTFASWYLWRVAESFK